MDIKGVFGHVAVVVAGTESILSVLCWVFVLLQSFLTAGQRVSGGWVKGSLYTFHLPPLSEEIPLTPCHLGSNPVASALLDRQLFSSSSSYKEEATY